MNTTETTIDPFKAVFDGITESQEQSSSLKNRLDSLLSRALIQKTIEYGNVNHTTIAYLLCLDAGFRSSIPLEKLNQFDNAIIHAINLFNSSKPDNSANSKLIEAIFNNL